MPALVPTEYTATIVWLGRVGDRASALKSQPCDQLTLRFEGAQGEDHGGLTRPSCSRVVAQHPRGTRIANTRQLCVMSAEEIAFVAAKLGIPALDPAYLGASIVLEGLPDFTHVPPSSRLQGPDGATMVVDMENRPCHLPAREIDADMPGVGKSYKTMSKGKRGVTCWVERPGELRIGDLLRLHIPDQRAWAPGLPI